jgi:hypothetical protein
MSTVGVRTYLEGIGTARTIKTTEAPTLMVTPEGQHGPVQISISFAHGMGGKQQVAVADRVLAGVQEWRDAVAAHVEGEQTLADRLVVAQDRIAELEAGGDHE